MDCADCTISLDTSLAKLARVIDIGMSLTPLLAEWLKPTKCWHTTARVIADGLRWLHYLTRHFVSQAIDTYEVLIPVSWQRAFLTTALVIASAEYAISLDTSLAKRLIPTKCWYTTARVIADGLRWIRYLTRHTVSQAIETYEVLIPVSWRLQGWLILEWLDTVSQAIETYEVLIPVSWQRAFLTTARVIASAEYAISLDTSLAKLARVIDIGMAWHC